MKKTIAIDINEVIRDYIRAFKKQYNKVINPVYDIDYDDVDNFDLFNVFPFNDEEGLPNRKLYDAFRYEDCAFEIFSRADIMENGLPTKLNLWMENTLRNLDVDKEDIPDVILFSPFEMGLTIPSTLGFIARVGIRCRKIEFPIDSTKMWDKADVMITANPRLLSLTPEGKCSVKIEAPYNKEAKGTYSFEGLVEAIEDKESVITKFIEKQ